VDSHELTNEANEAPTQTRSQYRFFYRLLRYNCCISRIYANKQTRSHIIPCSFVRFDYPVIGSTSVVVVIAAMPPLSNIQRVGAPSADCADAYHVVVTWYIG
jgi:hypothetical protein